MSDRTPLKTFYLFLIGIAAVGIVFLAFALLLPRHTGTVTRVGRISAHTDSWGRGRHRHARTVYASDVRVRPDGASGEETVYYRVSDPSAIPAEGDRVTYARTLAGYTPYPEPWAVRTALLLLGADALVWGVSLIARRRAGRRGP